VNAFVFEGSTVFSEQELARVTEPWTGRAITSEELEEAREAVTQHYVQRGYVTSGALIPDQSVDGGVVRIQVVEGRLAEVRVEGARWFRPDYFRARLLRAGRPPVDVGALERQLELFQRDPRIERVLAQLLAGERPGESVLVLRVEEARQYSLLLEGGNDYSPSLGGWGGSVDWAFSNAIGRGEELSGWVDLAEGLREYVGQLEVPLGPYDTRVGLHALYAKTRVVDEDFVSLDIESESLTYGTTLRYPFYRDASHELWLGLVAERRQSESRLLGEEFCFQPPVTDCNPTITVARAFQEWNWRSQRDAVAVRSMVSVGLGLFGATTQGEVDGEYVAWLAQARFAHRFPERLWAVELLVRADLQIAGDPLLSIEKFAMGGPESVRGYRENRLVRDNAVVGSVELRVPLWRSALGRPIVQLAPFADVGHGWDDSPGLPSHTLASVGVGLRVAPFEWFLAEAFWGARLVRLASREEDVQDEGFGVRVAVFVF
jgi:hemolysin activation/secretion protein